VPARQYLLQALPIALEVLNVYSEAQREGYVALTRICLTDRRACGSFGSQSARDDEEQV
jgi:hypothetical protein